MGYFNVAIEFWPRLEGFLSRQYIFRSQQSFLVYVVTVGFVLRQDLVLVGCSLVAAVVASYHDNVTTEVPLSRPR